MTISSGIFTIGGLGTNYPGVNGLNDAIADIAALTGNLTFLICGDVNLSSNVIINMNNYTFTLTTNEYHNGVYPSGGYTITQDNNDRYIVPGVDYDATSLIIVEKLKFYCATTKKLYIGEFIPPAGDVYYANTIVRKNIFKQVKVGIASRPNRISYMYLNKIYNGTIILRSSTAKSQVKVENNTVYNSNANLDCFTTEPAGVGQLIFQNSVVRNNLCMKVGGGAGICYNLLDLPFTSNPAPDAYNNASSDLTSDSVKWNGIKQNCLVSRVSADEFESLDPASVDFLKLKKGIVGLSASRSPTGNLATKQKCKFTPSLLFNPSTCTVGIAGMAPVYTGIVDIEGKIIPGGDDLYSIGCHEQQYV